MKVSIKRKLSPWLAIGSMKILKATLWSVTLTTCVIDATRYKRYKLATVIVKRIHLYLTSRPITVVKLVVKKDWQSKEELAVENLSTRWSYYVAGVATFQERRCARATVLNTSSTNAGIAVQ